MSPKTSSPDIGMDAVCQNQNRGPATHEGGESQAASWESLSRDEQQLSMTTKIFLYFTIEVEVAANQGEKANMDKKEKRSHRG